MGPTSPATNGSVILPGPHPSYIQVAQQYVFEQRLQECMVSIGVTEAKEDNIRLQGVTWIDNVRRALQLPVRTFNTAVIYYHKFRLVHPDNEYDYRDAAAAALFNACKIEDTLKKSREILCAAWNLKLPAADHLSSDDPLFEDHAKRILGLERLMLEASGFDFRNRYPQKLLIKLVKSCNFDKDTVGILSYNISLDLYRTFAPLKQSTQTMALACVELAARLCNTGLDQIIGEFGFEYQRWSTTRAEVMETLVDLLDLYTHHRSATLVGPDHALDTFIAIRITLNQEASSSNIPRYTHWNEETSVKAQANGVKSNPSPNSKTLNGTNSATTSPQSPKHTETSTNDRAKDGTVRFMLDPGRARDEKNTVVDFFKIEEVEEKTRVERTANYAYPSYSLSTGFRAPNPSQKVLLSRTDLKTTSIEHSAALHGPPMGKNKLPEIFEEKRAISNSRSMPHASLYLLSSADGVDYMRSSSYFCKSEQHNTLGVNTTPPVSMIEFDSQTASGFSDILPEAEAATQLETFHVTRRSSHKCKMQHVPTDSRIDPKLSHHDRRKPVSGQRRFDHVLSQSTRTELAPNKCNPIGKGSWKTSDSRVLNMNGILQTEAASLKPPRLVQELKHVFQASPIKNNISSSPGAREPGELKKTQCRERPKVQANPYKSPKFRRVRQFRGRCRIDRDCSASPPSTFLNNREIPRHDSIPMANYNPPTRNKALITSRVVKKCADSSAGMPVSKDELKPEMTGGNRVQIVGLKRRFLAP